MSPTIKPSLLRRLGRFCYRRHWLVVGVWIGAIVVVGFTSGLVGTGYSDSFGDFESEATRGGDLLSRGFGGASGENLGRIVITADQGIADPEVQAAMTGLFVAAEAAACPGVAGGCVVDPYENPMQVAPQGELAGRLAYADLNLPGDLNFSEGLQIAEDIRDAEPEIDGVEVLLGGQVFAGFENPESETLGLGFAVVILILAFGSVLAMGLPIGMALAGIAVGVSIIGVVSNLIPMPDFTTTIAVMLGLGVGIDYALFIVTRFREDLHKGMPAEEAAGHALDTAGRAVLFAGTTVVISVMGMLVMGLGFIRGLGIGSAIAVVATLIASITLLPALLGLAGDRLEITRRRGVIMAGLVALGLVSLGLGFLPGGALVGIAMLVGIVGSRPSWIVPAVLGALGVVLAVTGASIGPVLVAGAVVVYLLGTLLPAPKALLVALPPRKQKPPRETFWYRYSRFVQHHSWLSAIGGLAILAALALPVFGLRLGFSDEGNFPEDTDTRQAYDLLADGFGPGFNGPLLLVAEVPAGTDPAVLGAVTTTLQGNEGIAVAFGPNLSADGTVAQWVAVPTTPPQDEVTEELVRHLRGDALTAVTAGSGVDVLVTSFTAMSIDFSDFLGSRYALFFAVVLGLSFILLMAVFRSILVPLKAVLVNLLSIGAAYGVVVAVFQWGWGASVLGLAGAPIEPFIPMMLFAIVFGLSMDYEVFLLSRMKEEYDHTGNNAEAVADGLAVTARVITAAALIMVVVFGSFLLEADRVVKLMGTGLAVAVLLDATIVRMLLVPATMELLGDRNWWLPKWLDRLLPVIHVEGGPEDLGRDDDPDDSARELETAGV